MYVTMIGALLAHLSKPIEVERYKARAAACTTAGRNEGSTAFRHTRAFTARWW